MDGTLVDNTPAHIRAFSIFCDRYGVTDWAEKLSGVYGMGNDDIMGRILPEEVIREKDSPRSPPRRRRSTAKSTPRKSVPSRARELLGRLRTAGVRCAVGSSGCRANVDFVLERCGIGDFFDARISGDTVTRCKPDPEIYLHAAAALGADPADCVVFEDALAGIEAARRAGAGRIVALATTLTREQLLAEGGADAVVGSFAEVTDADLN